MPAKPDAPATQRNSEPILEVLRLEFGHARTALEIGSGTGQHAVRFAAELPHLNWQTSDRTDRHDGIRAWIVDSQLPNLGLPIELDVLSWVDSGKRYDAVFSANTAHIMGIDAVAAMFRIVASVVNAQGVFCLYGPFNEGGRFTSDSNESFDQSLRAQDPQMGIRNIEELDDMAGRNGMQRVRTYAMPANNQLAVWKIAVGVPAGPEK
jgi:cyclopropane fatty-acyl-phospholipid synthase-like methyltransferase